ncbi:MAG: phage terminase large subunit family protein [Ignavibacteriales bacterium]|nr:phage terminase large subunit family protein [Ignavibacteriales bacterium]
MDQSTYPQPVPLETIQRNLFWLVSELRTFIRPKPRQNVSEWALKNRYLSPEDCEKPGPWKDEGFEYLNGFMDAFNDPLVQYISVMKSAQTAFTQGALNLIGYIIDVQPGPILVAYPTESGVKKFSKRKLYPMLRDTATLHHKVSDSRKREGDNAILEKSFPGGFISMIGTNSPNALSSQSVQYLFLDELDRIPFEAGFEGDTVKVLQKRQQGFSNFKCIQISTPTFKGISRIEDAFINSDQRYYFAPCPQCNHFQTLRFENLKGWRIEKGVYEIEKTFYECENCKAELHERDKYYMVSHGEWRKTKPEIISHAGFFMNELYSSLSTWENVVKQFIDSKENQLKLRSFKNLVLGEVWEDQTTKDMDSNYLMKRCENYGPELPEDVIILTAGVDVQDDRLEMIVKGWGLHEESWLIDYKILRGDPSTSKLWNDLDIALGKTYQHAFGVPLLLAAVCIDAMGHFTQQVYNFTSAASRKNRRIYAVYGRSGDNMPIINFHPSKTRKGDSFAVGVDTAKELIFSRLSITEFGPGYMHFPFEIGIDKQTEKGISLDKEYFEQLTSEKLVTVYDKGLPKRTWKKLRARNEALDIEVYSTAAFYTLQYDENLLIKIRHRIKEIAEESKNPTQPVQKTDESIVRKKNWANDWR